VLQHYWVTPMYAYVRFGHWEEILALPEPEADLVYPRAIWRWSRGVANVRQGELDAAAAELAALTALAGDPGLAKVTIFDLYDTTGLVAIAREHLAGELAFARGEREAALVHLQKAISLEDALRYDEPPPWPLPTRQVFGAMLLEMDRPAEAEAVYRADLEIYPENGWSLRGLSRALAEQKKSAEAAEAEARFQRAWTRGDFELETSRL
jgi:tetratricopeptide (TPR) repeat protein